MKYIRLAVYVFALWIGAIIAVFVRIAPAQPGSLWGMRETILYGVVSLAFLYLSLLPSPLYEVFPRLPGKIPFQRAKKAFGISAFFFAVIHSWVGFFHGIGGWGALPYWGVGEWISLIIGFVALLILAALAVTSLKAIKQRMRPWWKALHRTVYLAAFLTLVHGVTITIHVVNLFPWLVGSYVLLEGLTLLELIRFDRFLRVRYPFLARKVVGVLFPLFSIGLFWSFFFLGHHRH